MIKVSYGGFNVPFFRIFKKDIIYAHASEKVYLLLFFSKIKFEYFFGNWTFINVHFQYVRSNIENKVKKPKIRFFRPRRFAPRNNVRKKL